VQTQQPVLLHFEALYLLWLCSRHDIGSVGVENAAPAAILASLEAAAPSFPSNRKEFTKQQLADWGLTATFDAKVS
jgi:hypothetical protein